MSDSVLTLFSSNNVLNLVAVSSPPSVLGQAVSSLQVVDEVVSVLVAPASPGPAGPPGPPGAAGSTTVTKIAVNTISGHVVVKAVPGGVDVASNGSPLDIGRVVGLTLAAAQANTSVAIQISGEVIEPTWAWTAEFPIFLGLAGALTQTPPVLGILQQIGVATTPTSVLVDIQTPIMRA